LNRRVVITGRAVLSPLGDSAQALHEGLCAGKNQYLPVGEFETGSLQGFRAMEIKGFSPMDYLGDKNFRPLDRIGRFAVTAAFLALNDAGLSPEQVSDREVGLFLGTVFCGLSTIMEFDRKSLTVGPKYAKPMDFANTVINAAAGQTAVWNNLQGVNTTVATGSTSSLNAIIAATASIRCGRADALLAGGAEALCFESAFTYFRGGMLAFNGQDAGHPVPFDRQRNGFALGEGAALLMLEERESARARGATILGEIKSSATGYDPSRGTNPEQGARALSHTLSRTLQAASLKPAGVDAICASANGSQLGDRIEADALYAVFGDELPAVTAPKAVLGETLGAGGAIQAIVALESMARGKLPGIAGYTDSNTGLPESALGAHNKKQDIHKALLSSVAYDGGCAALLLEGGCQ